MSYESVILSKYIAAYFNERAVDINMTKIQKLTYIAYGVYLAVMNERLVDEHPQAWPFGPVFPRSRNGLLKIDLNAVRYDDPDLREISADKKVNSLISLVHDTFGLWTATMLSEWSHKNGSPWEKTVSTTGFKWGIIIKDEYIRSYFLKIIAPNGRRDEK
jgi:uncharacterized phage-associated protein